VTHSTDISTRDEVLRNLVGPMFLGLYALVYNEVADLFGLPTVSSSIRWMRRHPLGAWIAGGVIGGLIAHWFLDSEVRP
jgi:hypothetical protein